MKDTDYCSPSEGVLKDEMLPTPAGEVAVTDQPLIMSGSPADRETRAKTLVTLFIKFLGDHGASPSRLPR